MSDNDFIIIDEEKETPVTTEGKESSRYREKGSLSDFHKRRNTRMSMRRSALSAIVRRA